MRNTGTIIATSDSATPIDNIAQKNTDVKEPFQSLGGGDYGREFTAGTQILMGEKAVFTQGKVRAQDAVHKRQIIYDLMRAAGVPVQRNKPVHNTAKLLILCVFNSFFDYKKV